MRRGGEGEAECVCCGEGSGGGEGGPQDTPRVTGTLQAQVQGHGWCEGERGLESPGIYTFQPPTTHLQIRFPHLLSWRNSLGLSRSPES